MSALGFNNSLGIHDNALLVRAQRSEVLANNLANADTPNYKARDMDFQAILRGEAKKAQGLDMARTDGEHIPGRVETGHEMLYRNPIQPSIDGNTVDTNVENAEFTKNAMSYNASFDFLNRKFKGLDGALRGQ
ncbi:flagellar basal body rod protein FlgB [Saccharospirillum salsuginis]|uniref:Flagellar basal body rod protein FlgB n=1 Tax=Saccharospirillum salsuginis TaxID=418750 RepID=A0A918K758_9GAMM|nr:flagellar basal body rod protein FlgB [Saccharospirillum salsuginis]GGX50510.1 flagellar basal body rod protein FlgB [Saccharospirillum salsuginis]